MIVKKNSTNCKNNRREGFDQQDSSQENLRSQNIDWQDLDQQNLSQQDSNQQKRDVYDQNAHDNSVNNQNADNHDIHDQSIYNQRLVAFKAHEEELQIKRRRLALIILACVLVLCCGICLAFALGAFGGMNKQEPQETTQAIIEPSSTENTTEDATQSTNQEQQKAENSSEKKETTPTAKKTICIDAGHSGHTDSTPSSASPYSDTTILTEPGGTEGDVSGPEYQICLDVALLLQTQLEAKGYNVVQVRTDNTGTYSPKDRALIANDCNANLFIRLHCDSAGSSAHGFYTLVPGDAGYQGDNELYSTSQRIGRAMHNIIVNELEENDRGVTVRDDQGGFNWCKVPAVLFEMANMDNSHDDALLATQSYRKKLAESIADATKEVLQ